MRSRRTSLREISEKPGHESWRHQVLVPDGVVVLASGGLDSCALIGHEARRKRRVFPVFVRSGMLWEAAELHWLRRFLARLPGAVKARVGRLKVVSMPMKDVYGLHWSTSGQGIPSWDAADNSVYLPGRNISLLAKAAIHAALLGVPRVSLGPLKGSPFPDASASFLRSFQRGLATGLDFPLKLEAPFLKLDKIEIIRRYGWLPLESSFSCSNPRRLNPCGACAKCRERSHAFSAVTHKEFA